MLHGHSYLAIPEFLRLLSNYAHALAPEPIIDLMTLASKLDDGSRAILNCAD
jgi:hypothetical protein